jgi:hypothetical protein
LRIVLILILFPFLVISQQTIDADQFFAMGMSTFQQGEKISRADIKFPWIEQYEFRTETRDFDFDQQEYTFRISPSTSKIRKAQKALYQQMNEAPDFESEAVFCDFLLSLQYDWLSLFILNEHKIVLEQLAIVLDDKRTIYERMAGTFDFDVEKLVKLETAKSDLAIALNEIDLENNFILGKYNIVNQTLDFNNFATIETITNEVNQSMTNAANLLDPEIAYDKQMLIKEYALEEAEKKQLIDFAQLRYVGPHSDLFKERLSLGLGFQIPNSGNRKLKMQELQIRQDELDREAKRELNEQHGSINELKRELRRDMLAFTHFQKTMNEERDQLTTLAKQVIQKEGTSPLFLIDIEERYLSTQIKSLKKKEDLFSNYLELLDQSGKICQQPFVNYLRQ